MEQNRQIRDPAAPDSAGCMRLIEAVVRLAAEDYLRALRRLPRPGAVKTVRETTAFFRSDSVFFCDASALRASSSSAWFFSSLRRTAV